MASDLMQLGISGLRTSQKQLDVTSHNISNVHTAGIVVRLSIKKRPMHNGAAVTITAAVPILIALIVLTISLLPVN
ncbi:flagellar basal body protein [Photobacterium angustum]|uniref:flagellar basal body protein n=1 Tax=Photobacterium angustum TaxID=661 RepID=UPI000A9F1314|nr:flagellar basal body protein [Photobacterium angustum]